ncbi:MAG: NADH-quinone oxidoreductase subunit C [Anaerovibrio sp.]|nr:NADH-quinone oxidoreductase subunit C [Anaerovibrio sp.]
MGTYLELKYLEELKHSFASMEFDSQQPEPHIYVGSDDLLGLMQRLRENPVWSFDRMGNITSVDYKEYIEMVYMLYSRRFDRWVTVKCRLDREKPVVESMTQVWPGTEFEEREIYDLMGVEFLHHPDLRRILMPDNYTAHPLRKDFVPLQPKIEGGVLTWHKQKSSS